VARIKRLGVVAVDVLKRRHMWGKFVSNRVALVCVYNIGHYKTARFFERLR